MFAFPFQIMFTLHHIHTSQTHEWHFPNGSVRRKAINRKRPSGYEEKKLFSSMIGSLRHESIVWSVWKGLERQYLSRIWYSAQALSAREDSLRKTSVSSRERIVSCQRSNFKGSSLGILGNKSPFQLEDQAKSGLRTTALRPSACGKCARPWKASEMK